VEKKKKIYYEANNRYKRTEKGKEVQKKSVAKSQTKKFILELANDEDIETVENWIVERKNKNI
jgi:hypothetical protein fuD12_02674